MDSGNYKAIEFDQCEMCGKEYVATSRDSWRLITFDNGVSMQVCNRCAEIVADCTAKLPFS